MKMNMFEVKLGVYENKDEALHQQVLQDCLRAEEEGGRNLSNIGGFQSKNLDINNGFRPFIEDLVLPNFKDYLENDFLFGKAEIKLDNFWANINYQYSTNIQHVHPHTDFAFVYYCSCNEESGNLVFQHPSPTHAYSEFFSRSWNNQPTPANSCIFFLPPAERNLLFFPANIAHSVEQNMSTEKRVSIAGNISVHHLDAVPTEI